MSSQQMNSQTRRPRGRPKGTTKFEHEDLRLLAEFADLIVSSHHAKLAPFLSERGYEQKDIRRAQKRWRGEKAMLIQKAQLRADAAPPENLLEVIAGFVNVLSDVAETAQPAIDMIAGSLERARRRAAACEELGLDLNLPLDLAEPVAVDRAIRRYEKRVATGIEPIEFKQLTLDELPASLKFYATALMLHELSLEAAEAESQHPTTSGGGTAPQETK